MSTQKVQREKFVFFLSYYEAIQSLDDSDKILIYNALCKYVFYSEMPKLSPQLTALFTLMKPYLDKSIRFSEKQTNNRSKPNQTKNNQTFPNQTKSNQTFPNKTKNNQTSPNKTEEEIEEEIEKEIEIEGE